jgi:hypothetical protein
MSDHRTQPRGNCGRCGGNAPLDDRGKLAEHESNGGRRAKCLGRGHWPTDSRRYVPMQIPAGVA